MTSRSNSSEPGLLHSSRGDMGSARNIDDDDDDYDACADNAADGVIDAVVDASSNNSREEEEAMFPDDDTFEDALLISDFLTIYHCDYCVHKHHHVKKNTNRRRGDNTNSSGNSNGNSNGSSGSNSDDEGTIPRSRPSPSSFLRFGAGNNFISPRDLVSSIQYRQDIEKYQYISSLLKMMYASDAKTKLEQLLREEEHKIWERKQARVTPTGRMSRDEDAIQIVTNFEVWATKLIATEMLLHKPNTTEGGKGKVPSCSTLLNMASGDYFSWAMPHCKYDIDDNDDSNAEELGKGGTQNTNTKSKNSPRQGSQSSASDRSKIDKSVYRGTLAIPPNSLTWKEYLRLSIMVSSLQTKKAIQQASKSMLTNTIYNDAGQGFNPDNPIILKSFSSKRSTSNEVVPRHTPADLVALWVRAQRNTSAFLHLIDLFSVEFVRDDPDEDGKTSRGDANRNDVNNDGDDEMGGNHVFEHDLLQNQSQHKNKRRNNQKVNEQPKHITGKAVVKYVGNHKKIKVRIEKEAMLVDKLTNWAITNQVLFTHEVMRDTLIQQKRKEINFKKRRAMENLKGVGKKRKYNSLAASTTSVKKDDDKVKMASKLFILRWFARRNRGILDLVFSNESNDPHKYCSIMESRLASIKVAKIVKTYLLRNCSGSTDRTLARIDRRIPLQSLKEPFEIAIPSLLSAIRSAIPQDSALLSDVDFAENDFELLCKKFLGDASSSMLLHNIDTTGNDSYCKQLQSLPPPWIDKCYICNDDDKELDNTTKKICWNCGFTFHSECDKGQTVLLPKPIAECQTLSSLYWSPKFASGLPFTPDFTGNEGNITWTEKVLTLERKNLGAPWGVRLYNTEHCSLSLQETEAWLENGNDIRPLLRQTRDPPLRLPQKGMVAYEIHGGMAAQRAGLRRGDVITAVKVADDPSYLNSNALGSIHFFKDLGEHERMKIFKEQTLSIELTVSQPSIDIVKKSEDFNNAVSKVIKTVTNMHETNMNGRWYCDRCSQAAYSFDVDLENHIAHDAKLCQVVIRRIGMEWCSLPFHDEAIMSTVGNSLKEDSKEIIVLDDDKDQVSKHSQHVSLRRIDEMMDYIIAEAQGKPLSSNSSPFVAPPWAKDRGSKLKWSEGLQDQPFHLLCKGMGLIINGTWESNRFQEHRSELRRRFIKLFVSWCLDSTEKELSERQTCGPPLVARNAITPWLFQGCAICKVRRVLKKEDSCVCDSPECEKTNQKRTSANSETNSEGENQNGNDESQIEYSLFTDQLQYDYYSSFVGTTILVSPDDLILKSFEQKSKVKAEAMNGSFVFIVVSYVPSVFVTKETNAGIVREVSSLFSEESEEVGLFYLVPLISSIQLKIVLNHCEMRKRNKYDRSWFYLKVLSLAGIIVFTPDELIRRLSTTKKILSAIEESIYSLSFDANEPHDKTSKKYGDFVSKSHNKNHLQTEDQQSHRALVSSQSYSRPLNPYCSSLLRRYKSCFEDHYDDDPTAILSTLGGRVSVPKNTKLVSTIQMLVLVNETLFAKSDLFQLLHFPEREQSTLFDAEEEVIDEIDESNKNNHHTSRRQLSSTENNVPRNPKFLHGLVLFRNISAVTDGTCMLAYSDLLYWEFRNERSAFWTKNRCDAMKRMESIVYKQTLSKPEFCEGEDMKKLTLVLSREGNSSYESESDGRDGEPQADDQVKYRGIGWGLELMLWKGDEGKVRVGRIAPNSPAASAGFRPHDVIILVNNESARSMKSFEKLSRTLVGLATQSDLPSSSNFKDYPSVSVLYSLDEPVTGPVVVVIERIKSRGRPATFQADQPSVPAPPQQQLPKETPPQQPDIQEQQIPYNMQGYPAVQNPLMQNGHQGQSSRQSPSSISNAHRDINTVLQHSNESQRVYFDPSHLYAPGVNHSFLSLTEVIVLVGAIERKQPKLGLRLLSPLYNSQVVVKEYYSKITPYLKENRIESIPKLSEHQWRCLMRADWERSLEETGEVVHKEGDYEYKEPTKTLPLDRFYERIFRLWKGGTSDENDGNLLRNLNDEICGTIYRPAVSGAYHYQHRPSPHHPSPHGEQIMTQPHDNTHHQEMYNVHHKQNWDQYSNPQRIRGGGDQDESNIEPTKLREIPPSLWVGRAIYGTCTSTIGNKRVMDVYVGRVKAAITDDSSRDLVDLNIFYVSAHGKFNFYRQHRTSATKICLVPNCDEATTDDIAIENYNKYVLSPTEGTSLVKQKEHLSIECGPQDLQHNVGGDRTGQSTEPPLMGEKQSEGGRRSDQPTSKRPKNSVITYRSNELDETSNLIEVPKKSRLSSCSLGILPDGRILHWFSCDPAALYLRKSNTSESITVTEQNFLAEVKSFSNLIKHRAQTVEFNLSSCENMHSCIWGCTRAVDGNHKNREIVGFSSKEELDYHNKRYHSYSPISSFWERVGEGSAIKELCADLASHMCAKSWILSRFCTSYNGPIDQDDTTFSRSPFSKRVLFETKKVLNLYKNSDYKQFRRQGLITRNIHSSMKIWCRICQLFEVESTGRFRQSIDLTHYQCISPECGELNCGENDGSDEEHLIKELESTIDSDGNRKIRTSFNIPLIKSAKSCLFNKVNPLKSLNCRLCRISGEHAISSTHQNALRRHGIGCGLLFDLCGKDTDNTPNRKKLQEAIRSLKVPLGEINETKLLLMKVASNVPSLLYLSESKQKSKHEQHQIWTDSNIDIWICFVSRCINTKMLVQAYVMLVNSINSNKMPMWWKATKSGWGSSFALMQMPSLSSVALHLYTLDAAIASSVSVIRKQITENIRSSPSENQTFTVDHNDIYHGKETEEKDHSPKYTRKDGQSRDIEKGFSDGNDDEYEPPRRTQSSEKIEKLSVESRKSDRSKTALSLELKMKNVVRWANEEGAERFSGESNDECLRCGDGGELLLCEFCANVVHQECIGYKGDTEKLEFVCDDCINDWYKKKSLQAEKSLVKMKKVIQWAEEEGKPRYIGESNDECCKCGDGGQILLCEFCPSGVHQECIGYGGSLDDIDYVCHECVEGWYKKKGYTESEGPGEIEKYTPIGDIHLIDSGPLIVRVRRDTGTDYSEPEEEMEIEEEEQGEKEEHRKDTHVVDDVENINEVENPKEDCIDSGENTEIKTSENDDSEDGLIKYLNQEASHDSDHGRRCKFLLEQSSPDRMRQVVSWADEKFIPRKDGEHSDFCLKCGNGEGDSELYLCEFCENVIHHECIGFTGNMDDIDFVCNECMIDLLQTFEMWVTST